MKEKNITEIDYVIKKKAAKFIQAVFIGYRVRKELKITKIILNRNARILQRYMRKHHQKKQKQRKIAVSLLEKFYATFLKNRLKDKNLKISAQFWLNYSDPHFVNNVIKIQRFYRRFKSNQQVYT